MILFLQIAIPILSVAFYGAMATWVGLSAANGARRRWTAHTSHCRPRYADSIFCNCNQMRPDADTAVMAGIFWPFGIWLVVVYWSLVRSEERLARNAEHDRLIAEARKELGRL